MGKEEFSGLLAMAALAVLLIVGLRGCEKEKNSRDETHLDQKATWARICVEGQVVLTKKEGYSAMSITKLDLKTGLPISCER